MDQELKQKWVDALESGKYVQGKGRLKNNGFYCCLGVLAEIAGCKISETRDGVITEEGEPFASYNPIKELLGGGENSTSIQTIFTSMNDSQGKTFKEIAEYIKTNL